MSNPLIQRHKPSNDDAPYGLPEPTPMHKSRVPTAAVTKAKRKPTNTLATKALIAAASVTITLSGWALFVAQDPSAEQSTQSVAYAQSAADNLAANTAKSTDSLRLVTLPAAVDQTTNNAAPTSHLRAVTAPAVVDPAANNTGIVTTPNVVQPQPRLRIRTRSSR